MTLSSNTWTCVQWRMDAAERYAGNFTAKTNNPILLVHSEYDPATWLQAAYQVSEGYEGSVVLKYNGHGVSAPSLH